MKTPLTPQGGVNDPPRCVQLLGYDVCTDSHADCISDIVHRMQTASRCYWLACLNPHSYAVSRSDDRFAAALRGADWLVPDGIGVVIASWLLGGTIRRRLTGPDIFFGLHERLDQLGGGGRVFFLGASEDTLEIIRRRMASDYPNVDVAGTYSPPYRMEYSTAENDAMIEAVNICAPDVLWVAMTAPKQEKWLWAHKDRLNVKFAAAVGAVFDFYAGKVKRAPPVFQRIGLDWLPRLLQEPRRLWRRMLISAPVFMFDVMLERLGVRRR